MSQYFLYIIYLFIIYECNCTVGQIVDKAKLDFNLSIKPKTSQSEDGRRSNTNSSEGQADEATHIIVVNGTKEAEDGRRVERPGLRMREEGSGNAPPKPALRIRGGHRTEAHDNYPYIAAILINEKLWCAGAIVDENWILTAAHCLNYVLHVSPMNSLSKFVKVRVGAQKSNEGGMLYDVYGAVRHPKFEEEPVPHADIALLKLTENLVLSKYVNIIKVYDHTWEPYAATFVLVAGFGASSGLDTHFQTNPEHQQLKSARLKVKEQSYCTDAYQLVNGFQFTPDFFCASFRNGTRDACLFDAGAPAVYRNRLMGIMSFGPERCGDTVQPAVFIKAFYFRDFVRNTIQAYKTTSDLIAAMKEVNSDVEPEHIVVDENHAPSEALKALTAGVDKI